MPFLRHFLGSNDERFRQREWGSVGLYCDILTEPNQCSDECNHTLANVSSAYGCCVDTLWTSPIIVELYSNIANKTLWSTCGLDYPGFCDEAGDAATASSVHFGAFLILLAGCCLLSYNAAHHLMVVSRVHSGCLVATDGLLLSHTPDFAI